MTDPMAAPIPVWHNGQFVNERDLTASGSPPAPAQSAPQSEAWELIEGWEQAGIQVRWAKGKKYYRACAQLDDFRYPGERGPVYSKEYRACDEADATPTDAYRYTDPRGEQRRRDISAAVARSHMKPDQAAMSDMRKVMRELEADLAYPYKHWQMTQERHRQQLAASADLRGQVAMMAADSEEFGMQPEYEQFIEQLQTLLEKKGKA